MNFRFTANILLLFIALVCWPIGEILSQDTFTVNDLPPVPREVDATDSNAKPRLKFKKKGGLVYCVRGEDELKCDVYIPEGEGPYPAVLAVHGGAWRSGSKLHLIRHAWEFAARGYVVVSINYRHAPSHKFPKQVHDCHHALCWMRHNADKFKIDPKRIAGYGYSAGGNLVSLLANSQSSDGLDAELPEELADEDRSLQAVIAGGAPLELSWAGNYQLSYWLGASKESKPEIYLKASPTTYLDKDDPPAFVFHGVEDRLVPLSTARKMKHAMNELGLRCELVTVNKGHLATFNDFDCLKQAIDFLDEVLAPTNQNE